MSIFNELEQETIREHCGDWVLFSVDELDHQLAAERAKVALAIDALTAILREADHDIPAIVEIELLAEAALASLQSSDALADIRRGVARECAEICDDTEIEWMGGPYNRAEDARKTLRAARDAIRAKFGVTE